MTCLTGNKASRCFFVFQSCDIKSDGRKRFLTLKNVQLDQAGEVSYQALNAVTTAMLTVKGTDLTHTCNHNHTHTRFVLRAAGVHRRDDAR